MQGNKYTSKIQEKIKECLQLREIKDGWKEIKKGDDLVLSSIKYKDHELKLSKIEGTIKMDYVKAGNYYMSNYEGQKNSREMCEQFIRLETVDENTNITFFKTKSKLFVSSRELIGIQNITRLSQNELLVTITNLDEIHSSLLSSIPLDKGAVRGQGIIYAVFLTQLDQNTTKIEGYFLVNPKGNIPTSVVNMMIDKEHTGFVNDIKIILKN